MPSDLTTDEIDRCAEQVNDRDRFLFNLVRGGTIEWSQPQDPTSWALSGDVVEVPAVPFRQHYDHRTGHMVITLIDPEDFYE